MWASWSTPGAAGLWAGRSPITSARSWWSTPCRWRSGVAARQPVRPIAHSDHGSQYTSWAFGRRLRAAGLLGSMGSIGDAYGNALCESFFHTLQLELLDEHHWHTRRELAQAVFEWIETWYNASRRHSSIEMLSPVAYENLKAVAPAA